MNIDRLMRQLAIDEGRRLRVYKDTKGLKTVGIGHLIKASDPQWLQDLDVGDKITEEQLTELFTQDLAIALSDAKTIFEPVWDNFPDMAQEVIINMLFNMGRTRFLGFEKTIAYAYEMDWKNMATEMLDSKWARIDVGQRAYRLSAYIERL